MPSSVNSELNKEIEALRQSQDEVDALHRQASAQYALASELELQGDTRRAQEAIDRAEELYKRADELLRTLQSSVKQVLAREKVIAGGEEAAPQVKSEVVCKFGSLVDRAFQAE